MSRPAPERQGDGGVRLLVHAGGELERAAADVDDEQGAARPPEPAPGGEEGQSRLVLAGQHLEGHAGRRPHPREHLLAVGGLADGAGDEGHHLLDALVLRDREALVDEAGERGLARSASMSPASVTCSESRSSILCEVAGRGWAPRWASTTSRCTVLEPTSMTPRRMAARYDTRIGAARYQRVGDALLQSGAGPAGQACATTDA